MILALICLLSTTCVAQRGVLIVNQDARIDTLVMKQRQIHVSDSTIDGFRVNIFMEIGNDALHHADSVKMAFEENYPEVPIYLVFGQPYYRVRVGDFRTRLEAENMYQRLKKEYKNAFVTRDRIEMPYIALCSHVEDYHDSLIDNEDKRVFIEEEVMEFDTLFFYDLYNDSINDSINIMPDYYYDE